jgi:hypothetical protein
MCAVVRLRALMARHAARLITNPPIAYNSSGPSSDLAGNSFQLKSDSPTFLNSFLLGKTQLRKINGHM